MFRSLLLVVLLALLFCSTSAQTGSQTSYFISRTRSVEGNDIDCKQVNDFGKLVNYCRECGDLAAMADKCTARPDCKGFDMENFRCGYLKTKATPDVLQRQEGFTSFCKGGFSTRDTNGCSGDYQMWLGYDAAPGSDFKCGYKEKGIEQPYCRRNGDHLELMKECDEWAECGGIVIHMESGGQFGWLKRADKNNVRASLVYRPKYMYLLKTK